MSSEILLGPFPGIQIEFRGSVQAVSMDPLYQFGDWYSLHPDLFDWLLSTLVREAFLGFNPETFLIFNRTNLLALPVCVRPTAGPMDTARGPREMALCLLFSTDWARYPTISTMCSIVSSQDRLNIRGRKYLDCFPE